ncbi:hypothetical protein AmDm5_1879 [Acetobacter malorum]|uniref:Uncharacterized protein n=1 Tax=Acetobacter malorum TaxID=178901 RepID=A0A087PKH4_9PROT|nr:hypothetical protein [Acetobacter malorum]KFL87877.1 hypothetical protein AmDm5_1879 [Acetobacter malorum]OAG75987.1 hypothetical protein Amal_01757 [Acetobacter malorum]
MTATQSGGSVVADGVHARLDDHEERIAAVERRQDVTDGKLDGISRDIAAVRAEGNARAVATTSGIERLGNQFVDLTRQLATHTGAQEERNRLAQEGLQRWRTRSVVVGIVCTIAAAAGGTILSSQTWDDYLFGNVGFLHHHHIPAPTPPAQQPAAYVIAPRSWEKS